MGFLDGIRSSGILPKRQGDRPFGMPDIDSGNVAELFRQIGPLADSMNNREDQRAKEMMQFQQSLRSQPQGPNIMERMSRANTIPNNPGGPAMQAQAPPTSMQRQLAARDEEERGNKFRSDEISAKLAGVMDEAKLRDSGETARLGQTLSARQSEGAADRGSHERISQNELAARVAEAGTERANRVAMNNTDNTTKERIAGMPPRANPRPQDQFEARVQNFKIQNPDLANKVVFDETSKSWKLDTKGMTPEQLLVIQKRLSGNSKPNPPVKPMTSRDK